MHGVHLTLPNGLGMPPQDAGIAIFPAHRLPESVTGIRNGSLLSVASVIDRRRAWHRVLPWNFVFRFLVGFLSPTNTPNLTNGQQNAQASWHEFPPPTHPATFFALQNFSLAGKCWKFSTTNLFFFQMMDIAEAEVLTFHQSYERRVFFGAFVRHLFFLNRRF